MDESIVRGLVMGGVLGAIGLTATMIWKLIRSPSEAARRFKIVLMVAAAILYVAAIISSPGDAAFLIGAGVVAVAGFWVFRGTKK